MIKPTKASQQYKSSPHIWVTTNLAQLMNIQTVGSTGLFDVRQLETPM